MEKNISIAQALNIFKSKKYRPLLKEIAYCVKHNKPLPDSIKKMAIEGKKMLKGGRVAKAEGGELEIPERDIPDFFKTTLEDA